VLVGANDGAIIKVANDFEPKGEQRNVFGCGDASEKIREIIGILFVRTLKSSFIQKDLELLRKHFDVRVVDWDAPLLVYN